MAVSPIRTAPFTLENATVSGNQASTFGGGDGLGGGLYEESGDSYYINNSTIADNAADAGGGIYDDSVDGGGVHLSNSILANNYLYNEDDNNCDGAVSPNIVSGGYNLISDDSGCSIDNSGAGRPDLVGNSEDPIDPLISSLTDNTTPP